MIALLSLLACSGPGSYCTGSTQLVYDPLGADKVTVWPDDTFTVEDEDSSTGRRVTLAQTPWYEATPDILKPALDAIEGRAGFGTQAEIVIRFSAEVGELPGPDDSTTDAGLQLWNLDTEERVAYEARLSPHDRQIQLLPLQPLDTATRYAAVVTTAQGDDEGQCMSPSPTLRAILDRNAPEGLESREKTLKRALKTMGIPRDDVTALTVFTTHDDHQPFLQALEVSRTAEQSWGADLVCTQHDGYRSCDTTYSPLDFRVDELVTAASDVRQEVDVRIWLPDGVENPPVIVYGHGLGQDLDAGFEIADIAVREGFAMIGTNALYHGTHPTAEGDPNPAAFLGIDMAGGLSLNPNRMRGAFDQPNLERRQLLTLLRDHPDLDGDGIDEVDPDRIAYLGISLGGILGSGLLVGSDDIDIAVLAIAGGNLSTIVRDSEFSQPYMELLQQLAGGSSELQMVFSLLQTAIDPSDPTLYASHVLRDRVVDGTPPHMLLPVATLDEVVPFAAGQALARAYQMPHVEPVFVPVPGLPLAGASPVAENVDGRTVGYFQYDRITRNGEVRPSEHLMPRSEEFGIQLLHLLDTWDTDDRPEIVDPYAILDTPELP